jgi:hypothetical protein
LADIDITSIDLPSPNLPQKMELLGVEASAPEVSTAIVEVADEISSEISSEQAIVDFLRAQPQGARLLTIEQQVKLRRSQTITALSNLMRQGQVIQVGRYYKVVEQ